MLKSGIGIALVASLVGLSGCATKAETIGTAGGMAAGAAVSNGGTLGTPMGNVAIKSGRVNGNQIRLTATVDMGGQSIDAIISGTIEGDSMRGTMVMGAMGSFDFTGTRPR